MTNEQILKKAIEKAVENGYRSCIYISKGYWKYDAWYESMLEENKYFQIIFSHDFAKAFWGLDFTKEGTYFEVKPWMYHLQKMVLETEPLKYLEKFYIRRCK